MVNFLDIFFVLIFLFFVDVILISLSYYWVLKVLCEYRLFIYEAVIREVFLVGGGKFGFFFFEEIYLGLR